MKLLVIWRPDEPAEKRIALVEDFVARCRNAGLISIVEPESRKPHDGRPWDLTNGIAPASKGKTGDLLSATGSKLKWVSETDRGHSNLAVTAVWQQSV